ncbi:MAG: helix-turn-helix transcriptional regulator [Caldilineaceae bacterium]|nr:helix-turn-helix transcriptional regulator [Caldilineaceae bacterium]
MSLKHALLALLHEKPSHGYELKSRFSDALGPLWPLREAQIYNNLRILERDGLVVLDEQDTQDGGAERKPYCVTDTGRAALADWLESPVRESRKLKDDFYLKLSILAATGSEDRLWNLLWQQREVVLQRLRELEPALAQAEVDGEALNASLLEGAILHTEADLAWLDRCEERLLGGGEE